MFPTILIVDDEPTILQSLEGVLTDEGFEVITASNGYEALKKTEEESPDLVLLDIWMPGLDGIETLKELKKNNPSLAVVMITGHGTIETAIQATKSGAYDFIEKPLSIDRVIVAINNALNFRRLEEENKYLKRKALEKHSINGNSKSVQTLKQQIAMAAPTDSSILISGENGTGKELVARTIHHMSVRAEKPFIIVNCATIAEEQIDSELFGHEKGSLPGSSARQRGKFELAAGGTLLLDEIGDMSSKTQSRILQVLEKGTLQRVGGTRTIDVDVRVIAASNKDLKQEIALGNFREDLFFRLNVIPIILPPLRDRMEDLKVLTEIFMQESGAKYRIPQKELTEEAFEMLSQYSWPGNVRELKNLIDRLNIMVKSQDIKGCDIPAPYNPGTEKSLDSQDFSGFSMEDFKAAQTAFELEFARRKLMENDNDVEKTAGKTGISKNTLKKILKQFNENQGDAV